MDCLYEGKSLEWGWAAGTWWGQTGSTSPRQAELSATSSEQQWHVWTSLGLACPRGETYRKGLYLPVREEEVFLAVIWVPDCNLINKQNQAAYNIKKHHLLSHHQNQELVWMCGSVSMPTSLKASLNSPPGAMPSCSVMWAETFSSRICMRPDITPFWWSKTEQRRRECEWGTCYDSQDTTVCSIAHLFDSLLNLLQVDVLSLLKQRFFIHL